MKRFLFALLCTTMTLANAFSQGFPEISTDENVKWYLIQFSNGGDALTAKTSGTQITIGSALGSDTQLWKITGNATDGYTFTNKKGYTLYVNSAATNQMVNAATSPSGVSKFFINETTHSIGGYEIQPKGNTGISMNLWGGPGDSRACVGLWNKGDQNNAVKFVEASAFENMSKVALIPYPQEITIGEKTFDLTKLNAIAYNSEDMKGHIESFAAQLKKSAGIELAVKKAEGAAADGEIWFGVDSELNEDGYTLNVNENGIEIKAKDFGGEFYALQTLTQLLPRDFFAEELCSIEWSIPVVAIKDHPQFQHRGFMMDVARHFFDKEQVKKVLDIMALYKMNRLHWHLTDDQGWRIEIPEYPKLTEIGSIRSGSFTSNGDGAQFFDDTEYGRGMWFTQDDLREIVKYAAERNIDILPEIDLPGHMVAAVASYPEFSCDPTKEYSVRIPGGISHDVLNIGKDEVVDFLKCVLRNVAEIFPFPYIHLGGDECPTEQWQTNADCLRRVQEEGLAGVHELQSWLVEELGAYLKTLGENSKDIVVWDEVLKNWNTKNKVKPVIMAWNDGGAKYAKQAADLGFNSILCPYSHVYIDFMQVPANQTNVDEPYYGGWGDSWVNTIDRVYSLNPLAQLDGKENFCWGAQCNLWAETLNDGEELEYQLLPRMLALAEVGWLHISKKNWANFYNRLQSHDEILDYLGYTYAKHYIEPKEYTAAETAIMEAEELLDNSIRGGVGYPAEDVYDALQSALAAVAGDDVTALNAAIKAFKSADIVQPQEGKIYQVVSASTYYKRQYEGSTMYQSNSGVRFHYTPQTEPEELWQFIPTEGGYIMKNLYSGKEITMASYNAAVQMTDAGTVVRVDKATIATRDFTYVPGAVTISAVKGYNAAVTGTVKRLSAEVSGDVYAKDEAALCYNGTWRIVEVEDFTAQLAGLVKKCELIIIKAKPGEMGEPTQEALDYLQNSLITPAAAAVENGGVTEEQYNIYVALYHQFMMMPRTSLADSLDTNSYYYIRNVYFTNYYAAYNSSNKRVLPKAKGAGDNFLWSFVKNADGTVYIYSKANGQAAYIASNADDQAVMVGREYSWTLKEATTDTGNKGIAIIGGNGSSAWYTNPSSWQYILTKPYTWGASVWSFEKSNIEIETAIEEVETDGGMEGIYDLQGRKVENPTKGLYIVDGKKMLLK